MSAHHSKKDIEHWHLSRLKEAYGAFPIGEVHFGEKPDFRVQAADRLIGIELTQLFREATGRTQPLREIEQLRQVVTGRAEKLFLDSGGPHVDVAVNFNEDTRLTKPLTIPLAAQLARLVKANLPQPGAHLSVEYDWLHRIVVPEGITYVRIAHFAHAQKSAWHPISGGYVPDVEPSHIQAAIDRKAGDAVGHRQLCQEAWLVIVADGFTISSMFTFGHIAQNHQYFSPFDRTIYFENFSRHAFDLKTQPPAAA